MTNTEQVHTLRPTPEEVLRDYKKNTSDQLHTLELGDIKVLGKMLLRGKDPSQVAEFRKQASLVVLGEDEKVKQYAEENLPALTVMAKAEAEAAGKHINLKD